MSTANMNLMSGQSEGGNSGGLPEAVIFDMDGTLVATTEADFKAWQRLFLEYGRDLTFPDYFPLLGRKSQDVVEQILGLQGQVAQHAMARKMELFEDIVNLNGIQTLPNVESFLSSLNQAGIPLALATSSRKMKMQLVMEESGLARYFTAFVTGEEVEKGKPNPDIFILAARKLGVGINNCLVLEDAYNGIAAAKAAGMKCIAIVSTHDEKDLQHADMVIRDFKELSLDVLATCMGQDQGDYRP